MSLCRVAVAASGGRDSTALLHATVRAAKEQDLGVWALHVHHGLMPQAGDWWRHLQAQCHRWARNGLPVQFQGFALQGSPGSGESVEAWARRERYRALTSMAHALRIDLVLLAHHRRDQAETVMLQALRSAGPAGLSGMPQTIERDGIRWVRPWLNQPSTSIDAYVRRHRLSHVDDISNRDPRFARSRMRLSVWPALADAFPHGETALLGVARRMQEANAALAELAQMDGEGGGFRDGGVDVVAWAALSTARRALLLRHWAQGWSPIGMPESLVSRLLKELPTARTSHRWPAPGGELQLQRGGLLIYRPDTFPEAPRAER